MIEVCGAEILCGKAGEEEFVCCEKEMKLQQPTPLPCIRLKFLFKDSFV